MLLLLGTDHIGKAHDGQLYRALSALLLLFLSFLLVKAAVLVYDRLQSLVQLSHALPCAQYLQKTIETQQGLASP